jgi:endonuclease YncB( thermonuclease family)
MANAVASRRHNKAPFPSGTAFFLMLSSRFPGLSAFTGALLLFSLLAACSEAETPVCTVDTAGLGLGRARVVHVVDGDTVHFASGDKVRLIGVNAPEMNHDGRPAEPLAREAMDTLRDWVDERRVWVLDGVESSDRYGRRLAHLFDNDGNSLEARLLRAGLAFHVAVAPNVTLVDCLQEAEREAMAAGRGVWGHARYQPATVASLQPGQGGFTRVRDRVTRVSFKRNGWWIQLGGALGVRVDRAAQPLFDRGRLQALEGEQVEVRGWIRPRDGWWQMQLTHPSMLLQD